MIESLEYPDVNIVQSILSAFGRIYNIIDGEDDENLENQFLDKFEEDNGFIVLDKITNEAESDSLAAQAARLLERFQCSKASFDVDYY
jgi:hypothetical protein